MLHGERMKKCFSMTKRFNELDEIPAQERLLTLFKINNILMNDYAQVFVEY